jgi:DNA-binding transcriptional ArsR family regulator
MMVWVAHLQYSRLRTPLVVRASYAERGPGAGRVVLALWSLLLDPGRYGYLAYEHREGWHMDVDMGQSPRLPSNPPEAPGGVAGTDSEQTTDHAPVEAADLLELLGDEYTYRVFEAVVEQARTGRELIDATGASKATVYRRLEELEEAGLVESTMNVAADGNHCKQFHAVVSAVEVSFDADGFSARIEGTPAETPHTATGAHPLADD